jgi:hypothetical protein
MIVAAAVKRGKLVCFMEPPHRHHHILHALADNGVPIPVSGKQGFIDDKEGFVGRRKAAKIALSLGQVLGGNKLTSPPNLYSEDLW